MNSTLNRRIGKSHAQKHVLRAYYASATLPKPRYEAVQQWYQQQYGQTISKSSIFDILSPKYLYLDTEPTPTDRKRIRDDK